MVERDLLDALVFIAGMSLYFVMVAYIWIDTKD